MLSLTYAGLTLPCRSYSGSRRRVMKVDKELLVEQIKFLYSYPWREQGIPEEVVGVINLLEAIEESDEYS